MTTFTLNMTQKQPVQFWDRGMKRLTDSLKQTVNGCLEMVAFLPPLLLYLTVLYIIWLVTRFIFVTRLALLTPKMLAGILFIGAVYFPLYFSGSKEELRGFFIFTVLLLLLWSIKTIIQWFKERKAEKNI